MIETVFFLLLIFPIWWLIIGYYLNCSSRYLFLAFITMFPGGFAGFMITFMCNGGAGGSSETSSLAWKCLSAYLVIYYIILAIFVYLGQRKKYN